MNVLLVNPINRSYVVMPSLGLGYLASVLRQHGHSVEILNCIKENMSFSGFEKFIKNRYFDLIGFQMFSYDLNSVKTYLSLIKKIYPDTITIAGGAHPSGDPIGTMNYLHDLDYAFKGEAEAGFPLFLDRLRSGSRDFSDIPGLIYRSNGKVWANKEKVVEDIDSLPMPAWDIIKPETYPEAPHGAFTRHFPTAPIIITRGCPYHCTFCAGKSITGPRMRKRSIPNVMEELRYLRGRGIREFHIEDENFTGDKNLVIEFCEQLVEENLGMSWGLPSGVRINTISRDLLILMEKAGCYSMAIGIEFGTQRMMDITKKRITVEMVREKMELFGCSDIKTTGFFLLGVPGDTIEEMEKTISFALELPLDRAQFNNFMPLPGSELGERLLKNNSMAEVRWDQFFVHDVAYEDESMQSVPLKSLQRKAYLKFYLRPKIVFNILSEIKSIRHFKYLLKRFFDAVL